MVQSLLRTNSPSASQEISRTVCSCMVHYLVHKSKLPQISLVHVVLLFPEDLLNIFLPSTPGLPSGLFNSGYPNQNLFAPLLPPIHATCPSYLILLYLITRVIFGEEYRSQSSSLCSLLLSPVTSSLLCPKIFLSTPFSNTLSLSAKDHDSRPYKTERKIIILYISVFTRPVANWKRMFTCITILLPIYVDTLKRITHKHSVTHCSRFSVTSVDRP